MARELSSGLVEVYMREKIKTKKSMEMEFSITQTEMSVPLTTSTARE